MRWTRLIWVDGRLGKREDRTEARTERKEEQTDTSYVKMTEDAEQKQSRSLRLVPQRGGADS